MKAFIDFDDVLFNTKKFVADIEMTFCRRGVPADVFRETYKNANRFSGKINKDMRTYDPSFQFKKIREKIQIDTKQLEKDFKVLTKDTSKYVFKDASVFLSKMHKKDTFVLSFGTNKFQKEKIKNSGIEKYFNKIIIINHAEKGKAIRKIIGNTKEAFLFIDDRVKFLEEVKNKYPFAKTILVKRKEGRYNDKKNRYCDFVVSNLNQALKIKNIYPVK